MAHGGTRPRGGAGGNGGEGNGGGLVWLPEALARRTALRRRWRMTLARLLEAALGTGAGGAEMPAAEAGRDVALERLLGAFHLEWMRLAEENALLRARVGVVAPAGIVGAGLSPFAPPARTAALPRDVVGLVRVVRRAGEAETGGEEEEEGVGR